MAPAGARRMHMIKILGVARRVVDFTLRIMAPLFEPIGVARSGAGGNLGEDGAAVCRELLPAVGDNRRRPLHLRDLGAADAELGRRFEVPQRSVPCERNVSTITGAASSTKRHG